MDGGLIAVAHEAEGAGGRLIAASSLFEVPCAGPTIELLLRSRRHVPQEKIEGGQNGAGECRDRDSKSCDLCHATTNPPRLIFGEQLGC